MIGLIYDAAHDPSRWEPALQAMRQAMDAMGVVAIIHPDSVGSDGLTLILGDSFRRVTDFLSGGGPPRSTFPHSRDREVEIVTDSMTIEEWHATSFYRDRCAPAGVDSVLSIEISLEDRSLYRLRFTRRVGQPAFGERERGIAHLLVPHLKRAFAIDQGIARDAIIHSRYAEACDRLGVATLALDAGGAVLDANRLADALLRSRDRLTIRGGKLAAADAREDHVLQEALRSGWQRGRGGAEEGKILWIGRDTPGAVSLLINRIDAAESKRAGRRGPAFILFARDPDFRLADAQRTAQRLFDITPTEAELVAHLVNGLSLQQAGATMGVAQSTVRSHLKSIFAKTGLSRQSSLMRRMLNSVAAFAGAPDSAGQG